MHILFPCPLQPSHSSWQGRQILLAALKWLDGHSERQVDTVASPVVFSKAANLHVKHSVFSGPKHVSQRSWQG